jgi:Flp pilus assembly secretin CpaC
MQAEPRSKALFVFVGKRGQTMKVLTWNGSGVMVVHKKLDAGKFELPKTTRIGDRHVIVSDAIFEVILQGRVHRAEEATTARALSAQYIFLRGRLRKTIAFM